MQIDYTNGLKIGDYFCFDDKGGVFQVLDMKDYFLKEKDFHYWRPWMPEDKSLLKPGDQWYSIVGYKKIICKNGREVKKGWKRSCDSGWGAYANFCIPLEKGIQNKINFHFKEIEKLSTIRQKLIQGV